MTHEEQCELILAQVELIDLLQGRLRKCAESLRNCRRDVMAEVMGLYAHLEIIHSQVDELLGDA